MFVFPVRLIFLAPLALGSASLLAACGGSARHLHRANVYFERCYSAELVHNTTENQRHNCWVSWVENYGSGQPIERVDYARERILANDPEAQGALALAISETQPGLGHLPSVVDPQMAQQDVQRELDALSAVEIAGSDQVAPVPPGEEASDVESRRRESTDERNERYNVNRIRRSRRRPIMPAHLETGCLVACEPAWNDCSTHCGADMRDCMNACRMEFRSCTRSCY